MEAENIVLNDSGERQVVEEGGEVLPHIGVTVLSEALIIETVNLGDLLALVVSSEDSDSTWVPYLAADQEGDSLD